MIRRYTNTARKARCDYFMRRFISRTTTTTLLLVLCISLLAPSAKLFAQQVIVIRDDDDIPKITQGAKQLAPAFRLERTDIKGQAELLTVFGALDNSKTNTSSLRLHPNSHEIPLVSILRDTLGDDEPTNDRLRYLWMLTYTRPSFGQRVAAALPFFYNRAGNKNSVGKGAPPAVMDLHSPENNLWRRFMWIALQSLLLDPQGIAVKASTRTYRRNLSDYRKAHIIRALAVLTLYQAEGGSPAFTPAEMQDIGGRLMLAENTFGSIIDDIHLQRVYKKQMESAENKRGHNWELLRQRTEAENLYFQPITTPDGNATHAVIWARRDELAANDKRKYDKRFLNIDNPWNDKRLRKWNGYTATWHFDASNHVVTSDAANARPVEMIPLALYGLDHPKIPILLVDFRDRYNPKRREVSRRALEDVTRNVLAISKFGDLGYFLGRTIYDFVLGRRGMDVNQPSRLRTYSQLKLLLALDSTLDDELRDEVGKRLETVSLNPLENNVEAEEKIARQQYAALMHYAQRPDGLLKRIQLDRRSELREARMNGTERVLTQIGKVASFGLYRPRADWNETARERLDVARRLNFHNRFLRQVARSSPRVEVTWDIERIRESLRYVAAHGKAASSQTANAAARIFVNTEDAETQRLSLNCLYRIDNETAKSALLKINQDEKTAAQWRSLSREFLRMIITEAQRIRPGDARVISSMME